MKSKIKRAKMSRRDLVAFRLIRTRQSLECANKLLAEYSAIGVLVNTISPPSIQEEIEAYKIATGKQN